MPSTTRPAKRRRPAYTASTLAFASAALSLYWTIGGTLGLNELGGPLEHLARERSLGVLALGTTVVVLKVAAGSLALALVKPWGARLGRRLLLTANGAASAVLVLWGGANVLAGAAVLGGVVMPSTPVDEYGLRWHVFFWDLWFLVWGVALALAVERHRRQTRAPVVRAPRDTPMTTTPRVQ